MTSTARPLGTTALDASTLDAIRAGYQCVDDPRVLPFLIEHPHVAMTLAEAAPRLREAFGEGVTLRLERSYFDSEDLLFARVYGRGVDADEAERRMSRFQESWWFEQPTEVARFLEFSVGSGG